MVPACALSSFLGRCEFHFMSGVLPVCKNIGTLNGTHIWIHRSILSSSIYALLDVVVMNEVQCSIFPYLAIVIPVFFDGLTMIKALK